MAMIVVRSVVPAQISQAMWPVIEAVLEPDEQARAARFAACRHRHEYIAAHALKRVMLSRADPSVAPRSWSFETGVHGKPAPAGRTDLHFNLSHCDGLVACAVRRRGPVGVDLECLDRAVPLEVGDTYFAAEEQIWLADQPERTRPAAFLRLWTLKEAVIKASGMGLALALDRFVVGVDPPSLRVADATLGDAGTWRLYQRIIDGRHLLALAWQADAVSETLDIATLPAQALLAGAP